jgi:hypothetical protein
LASYIWCAAGRYTRRLCSYRIITMSEPNFLTAGDAEQLARHLERHSD